jgi:hypothetical protein
MGHPAVYFKRALSWNHVRSGLDTTSDRTISQVQESSLREVILLLFLNESPATHEANYQNTDGDCKERSFPPELIGISEPTIVAITRAAGRQMIQPGFSLHQRDLVKSYVPNDSRAWTSDTSGIRVFLQ